MTIAGTLIWSKLVARLDRAELSKPGMTNRVLF